MSGKEQVQLVTLIMAELIIVLCILAHRRDLLAHLNATEHLSYLSLMLFVTLVFFSAMKSNISTVK